ncbi:cytochrome c biogenesis protein ResB [Desulfoluna spongiiphila]|uniref:cytochrome c biogenesis protein ResB n=1 Tax=Desulfoluna spongiiphila TaxID=419481 RepID=UPI0012583CD1|nr:cytochrome c biogenesis protein ResB [Desulfoluna spongiiphila]VVS94445.1 resb-like domain [Desulfoluna spongiiphila]
MPAAQSILSPVTDLFKSVRLTVALLLMLAATSILGTVIPQNKHASDYIQAFGEPLYRIFHILDLTDMYGSWWFILLIILLTLNITVCTVTRFRTTLKLSFGKGFKGFSSLPFQAEAAFERAPQDLEASVQTALSSRFSSTRRVESTDGIAFDAEKGRWSRMGADVVHAGILILLAGALVGSLFGYDGAVNVPEGESVDTIMLRNTNEKMPLGFTVRCNDFSISHYDTGSVKEYRSSLTVLEGDQEVLTRDIIVNKPLTYNGVTFYQSSYGSMGAKDFSFAFTEKATGKTVTQSVDIGETVSFAPGKTFTFDRYASNHAFSGRSVGEAAIGTLTEGGSSKEVVLLSRFSNFDKMRKGDWILSIAGHEHAYYTGLQVTYDPGVGLVYTGFLLMIAGCFVAFFTGHKKIRVTIAPAAQGSTVTVSGAAPKNKVWVTRYARQLLSGLG